VGRVRAEELVDPDSEDLDLADLAQVVLDQGDRERLTSAPGNRAARVRVKVLAALAEARERQAAGVTRHQESEPRARRALAPAQWRWKPA
jgi:hypothetical protein